MGFANEFAVVDAVMAMDFDTAGVDAFTLAIVKAERQARRLFTYLVFQSRVFTKEDVPELRKVLAEADRCYFEGFLRGIDNLAPTTVEQLIGGRYVRLRGRLQAAVDVRNKVFHGQVTAAGVSGHELRALVKDIRDWCEALAFAAQDRFGYDGFGRNSFQKRRPEIADELRRVLVGIEDYRAFVAEYVSRPRGRPWAAPHIAR